MPLMDPKKMLNHARDHDYAIGYFESWNFESTQAVIDAAERARSPVIIGFNGRFLANPRRRSPESIQQYAFMARGIAVEADVPVGMILNEANQLSMLIQGLRAGFNMLMYERGEESYEEYVETNRYLVKTAHFCDAAVEGEIGELPSSDPVSGEIQSDGERTEPDRATDFVNRTGVDALSVSVGNVHIHEGQKTALDLPLLEELSRNVPVPLVLHGGTGTDRSHFRKAVEMGVCKINVGTALKRAFLDSLEASLGEDAEAEQLDPHDLLGRGGKHDLLMKAREKITLKVIEFIETFGSENRAGDLD